MFFFSQPLGREFTRFEMDCGLVMKSPAARVHPYPEHRKRSLCPPHIRH